MSNFLIELDVFVQRQPKITLPVPEKYYEFMSQIGSVEMEVASQFANEVNHP